ncbi:MAG: BrnA antitoxin family protein [Lachnospiraceae bacterium]|nr:BrnA antitoxin family protein [Lachnospiraceae bacterium]
MITRIHAKDISPELTPEERAEVEAAAAMPSMFDEDCPEMTPEMLQQFKRLRREGRNKQTVSLRLSPDTLQFAKRYGKGYTSFLSRLLDEAIKDENLVRKCF